MKHARKRFDVSELVVACVFAFSVAVTVRLPSLVPSASVYPFVSTTAPEAMPAWTSISTMFTATEASTLYFGVFSSSAFPLSGSVPAAAEISSL